MVQLFLLTFQKGKKVTWPNKALGMATWAKQNFKYQWLSNAGVLTALR